jgi:hypothetical protein
VGEARGDLKVAATGQAGLAAAEVDMENQMLDEKQKTLEEDETRARDEWEEAWVEHHWKLLSSAKTDEPFRANLHPDFKQVKELLDSKERAYRQAQRQREAYECLLGRP